MNPNPKSQPAVSRREVLRRTILGGLALGAAIQPQPVIAAPATEREDEPFVPENDYPFFGAEPPSAQ